MIDNTESKIQNRQPQQFSLKKVLLDVSYFARNIYETETVTSGLRNSMFYL